MPPLRISAISYLNTAPLMWAFDHGRPPEMDKIDPPQKAKPSSDFEISYTIPSRCAEELRAGTADIGIIPAISYATIPDLVILPDAAIAAKGPVRSILLVSRSPLDQVRVVAADISSRSSVALAEVLFRRFLGGPRRFIPAEPDLDAMLARCDAALLIGDPALRVRPGSVEYYVFDLAELWQFHTGRPFVFAFWAMRSAALPEIRPELDLPQVLRDSRDHGLKRENLAVIAHNWSPRLSISELEIHNYLKRHIHYYLDLDCLAGLELFYRYSAEYGLIPGIPELRFLRAAACVTG